MLFIINNTAECTETSELICVHLEIYLHNYRIYFVELKKKNIILCLRRNAQVFKYQLYYKCSAKK